MTGTGRRLAPAVDAGSRDKAGITKNASIIIQLVNMTSVGNYINVIAGT
ncbi:MAG: hypothetical protein AB9834_20560 [Lentimicrobium sp.]